MKKTLLYVLLSTLCVNMSAQSVPFILRNIDPRAIAVASVSTENLAAANALSGKKIDISASYGMWAPESVSGRMIGFGGYGNIGKLSIGLSGRYNMGKEYDMYDEDARPVGTFRPSEMAVGLDLAFKIADPFSAGVRVNYISSTLAETAKAGAVGVDVSVAYKNNGFGAVLAARNLGSQLKYGEKSYKLPSLATLGASYSVSSFVARVEADYVFAGSFMAGVGVEYTLIDIFTFRAGFHYGDAKSVPTFASVGLGINFHGAMLNAAYLPSLSGNPSVLQFSLGYSF